MTTGAARWRCRWSQSFDRAGSSFPRRNFLSLHQSAAEPSFSTGPAGGGSTYTATATVSLAAMADAPNNPISQVAFYANGSLIGALTNSPDAPLYPP